MTLAAQANKESAAEECGKFICEGHLWTQRHGRTREDSGKHGRAQKSTRGLGSTRRLTMSRESHDATVWTKNDTRKHEHGTTGGREVVRQCYTVYGGVTREGIDKSIPATSLVFRSTGDSMSVYETESGAPLQAADLGYLHNAVKYEINEYFDVSLKHRSTVSLSGARASCITYPSQEQLDAVYVSLVLKKSYVLLLFASSRSCMRSNAAS
jgi:hypothetical protein